MFWLFMIAIASGILAGVFTGLTPGIHVNLISIIAVSLASSVVFPPVIIAVFIIALSVTHTFLDSIPSIFLGAPDSDQILNVLPGHRMLLEGNGYGAVKLTVIGSLVCLIITIFLIPMMIPLLPVIYRFLSPYIGFILIGVVLFTVLIKESSLKKRMWASVIFLLSGVLGIVVLNFPDLKQPLFPLLSGLFGISGLLLSLGSKSSIPAQKFDIDIKIEKKNYLKAFSAAVFSGSLTGLFPGLGSASAAIISMSLVGEIGMHAFMILIGGINTVNFVFSLATLYALEKARNGAVVAVMQLISSIDPFIFIVFLSSALVAGCFAAILALNIAKVFSRIMSKVNYNLVCSIIILMIIILGFYFSGWIGLFVLWVSTSLGMLAPLVGVKRSNAMGCLLLPVILYFI